MIDRLDDLRLNLKKATGLLFELLDDYNTRDEELMKKRLEIDAPRAMNFVEITSDYTYSTYKEIVAMMEELCTEVNEIREGGQA